MKNLPYHPFALFTSPSNLLRWMVRVSWFLTDCKICLLIYLILLFVSQLDSPNRQALLLKTVPIQVCNYLKLSFVRQVQDMDQNSCFLVRSHGCTGRCPYHAENYPNFLWMLLWITTNIVKPSSGSQIFCCQKISKFNLPHHKVS